MGFCILRSWKKERFMHAGILLSWRIEGCEQLLFLGRASPRQKWPVFFRLAVSPQALGLPSGKRMVGAALGEQAGREGSPNWTPSILNAWNGLSCAVPKPLATATPSGLWSELPMWWKGSFMCTTTPGMFGKFYASWAGVASDPFGRPKRETKLSSSDGSRWNGPGLKKSKKTGCSYRFSRRKRLHRATAGSEKLGSQGQDAGFDRVRQLEKSLGNRYPDCYTHWPEGTPDPAACARNGKESSDSDISFGLTFVSQGQASGAFVGSVDRPPQSPGAALFGSAEGVACD